MNPKGSKSGSRGLNPLQAGDTPRLLARKGASRRDARIALLFNQRFPGNEYDHGRQPLFAGGKRNPRGGRGRFGLHLAGAEGIWRRGG